MLIEQKTGSFSISCFYGYSSFMNSALCVKHKTAYIQSCCLLQLFLMFQGLNALFTSDKVADVGMYLILYVNSRLPGLIIKLHYKNE